MSEESTNEQQEQPNEQRQSQASTEESSATELPKDVQEKLAELERLKSHHGKLLDETKTAKQRAQELEQAQREAEEKRQKENGEFQSLYETERERAERLDRELKERDRKEAARSVEAAATKLVSQLTRDTSRSELLAEKVQQYASHTDGGVIYEMGGVQVDEAKIVEHLKERYPFLVDGSGASGGGAAGPGRPGGASDVNQAAEDAKKKGDLTGFLTAQLTD